jgi:2-polyprenyl-3-methyl-5-hydroxy-6-metoxy-1,4-benzoquinol methylase
MEANPYTVNVSRYSTHKLLADLIGKNKTVLDVGCNSGYIADLSDSSNTFYGLDYLEEAIREAKTKYKDALVYDLNKLKPLPWNRKFDVMVFADVLEHLNDPETALKFFVDRYLTPSGKVVISLPNVANWTIRLKLLSGKFDYTETGILDRTHFHLYTFKSAKALVRSAGLRVTGELGGSSVFGPFIKLLPPLRGPLAHGIVICAQRR